MGTTKHQGVNLLHPERMQVMTNDHPRFTFIQPALLYQRYQEGAWRGDNFNLGSSCCDHPFVYTAADSRPGTDNPDPAIGRSIHCLSYCRGNYFKDRHIELVPDQVGGHTGGRVAGDDDHPGSPLHQEPTVLPGILDDLLWTLRSIRRPGQITKIYSTDTLPGHAAWLEWPWKLHRISDQEGNLEFELYNLESDSMEVENLAEIHPDRISEMKVTLEAWQVSVVRSMNGEDY